MPVFLPVPGGAISVTDSTSLAAELSASGLGIGTKIWNIAVGKYFTLTVSTASLVTDQIVAVLGIDGLRWIVDTSSGTVLSVTGQTANAINNADPANPVVKDASTTNAGTISAANMAQLARNGANLTNADVTITPGTDKAVVYVLPPATLTGNHSVQVDTTGSSDGDEVYIIVQDLTANTYTIKNGAGSTIATKGASPGQAQLFGLFKSSGQWIFSFRLWVN